MLVYKFFHLFKLVDGNEHEQRVKSHFRTLTKTPSMQYFFYQCEHAIDDFFSFLAFKGEKQDKY